MTDLPFDTKSVLDMDLEKVYEAIKVMVLDYPKLEKDLNKIKYGIKLRFDINYHLKDMVVNKAKSGLVIICRNQFKLTDYWDELDNRKTYGRKVLIDLLRKTDPLNIATGRENEC